MPTNNDLVLIRSQLLTDIADAIRTKTGSEQLIYPADMDTEILSIPSETHSPITVNITQSANQTIRVSSTSASNWANRTTSGVYNVPAGIVLTATVTPNTGYDAGELNQTRVTAAWGSTVSFSATPAVQRIGVLNVTMSSTANRPNVGDTITVTYAFTAIGGGTSAQTFTNEYSGDSFTIPALNENRSTTHMETFVVEESDVISGYVDCDVLTNEEEFTKTGSFTIATAYANPSLSVSITNIDYATPLEEDSIVEYNVVVTNNGNLTLTSISISSTVANETWLKDSLAPGQSQIYYAEALVTSSNVEDEYITLDASATASNPVPNASAITASDSEHINIIRVADAYSALIYLVPTYDPNDQTYVTGFNVSSILSATASSTMTLFQELFVGDENSGLCEIWKSGDGNESVAEFIKSISPSPAIISDQLDSNYNENNYILDTSNRPLTEFVDTVMILDAYGGGAIFNTSVYIPIINNAINLDGLVNAINTNEADVSEGIFLFLMNVAAFD